MHSIISRALAYLNTVIEGYFIQKEQTACYASSNSTHISNFCEKILN